MKKLLCLLAVCLGVGTANAQITTGESSAKVIRTGNRAQAGNFGIYLGATTDMFNKIGDDCNFSAIPLINLKYMKTDKLEYRLGIEWWKESHSEEAPSEEGDIEQSNSKSTFTLSPGFAYHFSNKNLLDVYVGAELPFGFASIGSEYEGEDANISNFHIGLGAFIGLQAYIGNLPLAIGAEYGLSTMYSSMSEGQFSKDGMTIDFDKAPSYMEDYSASKWKLGHQVRVTLSYYFNL